MTIGAGSGSPSRIEYVEDRVPLDGIEDTVQAMVEIHGGETLAPRGDSIRFTLPVRQGIAASGSIEGEIRWHDSGPEGGVLTIVASDEVVQHPVSHTFILIAGVVGSFLFILWPFYPALGPASWVGGALAFAAYFLTLRRSKGGIVARLLGTIADQQRRGWMGEATEKEPDE